jgi:hypothetical protein
MRARSALSRGDSFLATATKYGARLNRLKAKHKGSLGYAMGRELKEDAKKATRGVNPLARKRGLRE